MERRDVHGNAHETRGHVHRDEGIRIALRRNNAVIELRPRTAETDQMEEGRLAEQEGHVSVTHIDVSIE